jgi:hypothetical protein
MLFDKADDEALAVFGGFDCDDTDCGVAFATKGEGRPALLDDATVICGERECPQAADHEFGFFDDACGTPVTLVRHEAVAESVQAHVGVGIGPLATAEEREAHDVVVTRVAVLEVVEEGEAAAWL